MANYVLVHGGDRHGSVWKDVAAPLETQGHRVFCPTMSSVKEVTLQKNIDEVLECIESNKLDDVILIGHSYGGLVITGVTDQIPDKIKMLGYLDASIPDSGDSLYDLCESVGFDMVANGLTKDLAVMSKLFYDKDTVFKRPKFYILSLESEFIIVSGYIFKKIQESGEEWLEFALDAKHASMFTHPRELAVIFSGAEGLWSSLQ